MYYILGLIKYVFYFICISEKLFKESVVNLFFFKLLAVAVIGCLEGSFCLLGYRYKICSLRLCLFMGTIENFERLFML